MTDNDRRPGDVVAVWHDQWVIDCLNMPDGVPDGLSDALHDFAGDRKELSPGTVAWLATKSDEDTAQRFAAAIADGSLFAPGDEGMSLEQRYVGVMAVAPALEAIGDDGWGFGGSGEPDEFDNPMGSWADPVVVYDTERYAGALEVPLSGALRLARALGAGSWSTCDVCDDPLDAEMDACVNGCDPAAVDAD